MPFWTAISARTNYSTAKVAVVGLTKTLAKEWGTFNVCVNCMAFGYIETKLTQSFGHSGKKYRKGKMNNERMCFVDGVRTPNDRAHKNNGWERNRQVNPEDVEAFYRHRHPGGDAKR